jgi:D-aspartate oxidase
MNVTIVGSGICGLTTALALQSQYPTLSISIIADKFDSETTSSGAAGIFRPGGGLRSSVHDVGLVLI